MVYVLHEHLSSLTLMWHAPYKSTEVTLRYQVPFFKEPVRGLAESVVELLLLSLSHTCSMGLGSGLTAGHSIFWMSNSRKTALVMRTTWALALSCMRTNSGPTPYAATNTCYSSICSIYHRRQQDPYGHQYWCHPTPSQNLVRIGRLLGQYLPCTAHHSVFIYVEVHQAVSGEIWTCLWTQVSIGEAANWRGYGQTEGQLRNVAALNGALKQDVLPVRILLLTCSLISGQTPWLQWPSWGLVTVLWQLLNDAATHR